MRFQFIIIITFFLFTSYNVKAQNAKTDSLERLLPITTDTLKQVTLLTALTWEYRNSNLKHALEYGTRCVALIQHSNYKQELPKVYAYIGVAYYNLGDYLRSMTFHYKALKLAQEYKQIIREAYSYNNIGDVFYQQGRFLEAITNIQKAIDIFTQINHKNGQAYGFLRLGEVFHKQGCYQDALKCFSKALDLRVEINGDKSTILHRIGKVYIDQCNYKKAMEYLIKALDQDMGSQDVLGECSVQNDMAVIYLRQNNLEEVIKHAKRAWESAASIPSKFAMYKSAELLQKAYKRQQNYPKAYYYQQQYIRTLKEFSNEEKGGKLDALRFSHQLEKQKVELSLKDKDIALLQQTQKEYRLRKSLVYVLLITVMLLAGLITVLIRWNFLKKKSNHLLRDKNQEIAEKNHEITVQNRELKIQQDEIKTQRDVIELRNRHITQSIKAAKTIQDAILPQEEQMQQMFDDSFVLYRPRDVVSGDFYWLGQVDNTRILGAVDCIGHGVSGAFMSMIGFALLNEIINTKKIIQPSKVLDSLRQKVKKVFRQTEAYNGGGMDIGLIAVESQIDGKVKVEFAGAKRPLWYITQDSTETQVVPGSRVSIGQVYKKHRSIENKTYVFEKGTLLYLSSDGFSDQNNVARTKFGAKQLTKLIYEVHMDSLAEQQQILEHTLDEFMRNVEQRDDILLMGIRL